MIHLPVLMKRGEEEEIGEGEEKRRKERYV